jgi:hypothetical protein
MVGKMSISIYCNLAQGSISILFSCLIKQKLNHWWKGLESQNFENYLQHIHSDSAQGSSKEKRHAEMGFVHFCHVTVTSATLLFPPHWLRIPPTTSSCLPTHWWPNVCCSIISILSLLPLYFTFFTFSKQNIWVNKYYHLQAFQLTLYCTILHHTAPYCTMLHFFTGVWEVHYGAVKCSVVVPQCLTTVKIFTMWFTTTLSPYITKVEALTKTKSLCFLAFLEKCSMVQ